jgi:FMN hydrolase / 5-amino-6-(5-phospho-D-ribitylamino)uracil phosphatase
MHRVTTIIFDLDNTLWDVWPVIVRAEQEMYAFLVEHYPRVAAKYSVEGLRTEREQVAKDEPHKGHDFTYLRRASLKRCAQAVGYDETMADEAFEVFYRARNAVTLYRDVLPALTQLHGRYRLLSLTNGNADLAAIGLKHYFDASFSAREVGVLKPDPAVFRHVLAHAQLDPQHVLHIGDDPIADVQGARKVGMHSLWMNRDGARWDHALGTHPITVSKLDELVALLPNTSQAAR